MQIANSAMEVRKWSVNARPGDAIVYYIGNLYMDTEIAVSAKQTEKAERLSKLRDLLYTMYKSGLVHLVQKVQMHGTVRTFQYIAVRAQPKSRK